MDAEELYFCLYDDLLEDGEYFQADSQVRHILPEAYLLAALGSILAAFAGSFFARLGERAAGAAGDKIAALFRRASREGTSQPTLEALELLRPYLPLLLDSGAEERTAEERWVSSELEKNGFPATVAQAVARRLLEDLRKSAQP